MNKDLPKRPKPWLDKDLADREGEEWRDVVGYDGLYQVSSHGRVKGLQREVQRAGRGPMRFPETIMTQSYNEEKKLARVGLSEEGVKRKYAVLQVVGTAFMPRLEPGQMFYHRDKYDLLNNSVSNILIGTPTASAQANCDAGLIPNLEQIAQVQRDAKDARDEVLNVLSAGVVVARICGSCMMEQSLESYALKPGGLLSRSCKTCLAKRAGIIDIGGTARKIELAKAGLRVCGTCKLPKSLDNDFGNNAKGFLGKHFACKDCVRIKSQAAQEKKRLADDAAGIKRRKSPTKKSVPAA